MKQLEDITQFNTELGMRHFDRPHYNKRIVEQQNLAAKEASACQAVGYVPRLDISAQDWEDQVHRNKISKARGGLYVMNVPTPRRQSLY